MASFFTDKMQAIRPLISHATRPFWSVMIPTYKARPDYLEETLESVLQQDPGPAQMQIEVVDDCSPDGAPVELVRRIAGDRVTVHREPRNNGMAGAWNRCIERARGEWVHILHPDDIVWRGFYERLYDGIIRHPHVGMAFCRFVIIDANGHSKMLGPLESATRGVLDNWLERVATGYHVEPPAVVVRRATYERLGGFRTELPAVLDVEMWVRIAAFAAVYYEPKILAGYRQHDDNASAIQKRTGANMQDMAKAIEIWKDYLPANSRTQLERQGRRFWADVSLMVAQQFFSNDDLEACTSQLRAAKTLWNRGQHRSRRLRLKAKVLFYRALGRSAISAVRELRRRIRLG
jgi:glycosyltransferase involved in cell wall biosynthesis